MSAHMLPRAEYPRPQFVRKEWMNLNGTWDFEMDHGCSGDVRGLIEAPGLSQKILVPFCPESSLSGIGHTDFIAGVWYKKAITLPKEALGKKVLLHFGAADYLCQAWVNGTEVGIHQGGYVSFHFDITPALKEGENLITVFCKDNTLSKIQPSGKQSTKYHSYGCFYTRTTGIWQTVWLEWMDHSHIGQVFYTPDANNGSLHIKARIHQGKKHLLKIKSSFKGKATGELTLKANVDGFVEGTLALTSSHLWSVDEPNLYDLVLSLVDEDQGTTVDRLESYFGLRSISFDGIKFLLNGKPVFQRLILDQGFYPDGIYTAPTDEALKNDILLSKAMGFNGARLHEKVFEARFLYWADHLGYLCWGEMANWGLDLSDYAALSPFLQEWIEAVQRDYSAPSIIGWCPFNETWDHDRRAQRDEILSTVYRVTKAMDSSRPCIDTSGNYHVETDIFDVHDYEQDTAEFDRRYNANAEVIYDRFEDRQHYKKGQPVFVSEYGGIWWKPGDEEGWGYGSRPQSEEEFLDRYEKLTTTLLDNPNHFGFCYTQLTDVEQEVNGLYTYERKAKFDPQIIYKINTKKAAIEKEQP